MYVRCWVNNGRHLLAASISGFDPTRTFVTERTGDAAIAAPYVGADFHCVACKEEYELKSQKGGFGTKVLDGAVMKDKKRGVGL